MEDFEDFEKLIARFKPLERHLYTKQENGKFLSVQFVALSDGSVYLLGTEMEVGFEENENSFNAAIKYLTDRGYKLAPPKTATSQTLTKG